MSQQPTGSRGAAAPDELIQLLKSSSNDPVALHKIVSCQDTTNIVAVISSLLSSLGVGRATSRKKARYRPALSDDCIIELLLFMDRDTLDSMQLVCRFVRDSIATLDLRLGQLALRLIERVEIGEVISVWTPIVKLIRDEDQADETVVLHYIDCVGPYLRHAYCYRVKLDLQMLPHSSGKHADDFYRRIFDGLNAEETQVNILCVNSCKPASGLLTRSLQAFKSVKFLHHEWIPHCPHDLDVSEAVFDEEFFVHAASRGVRDMNAITCVSHMWPDTGLVKIGASAALAFGFAEPESGGERELLMADCELRGNLLTHLRQKASELDGGRRIHFQFKLIIGHAEGSPLNDEEFEKYHEGDLTWLIDDLENGITLEINTFDDEMLEINIEVSSTP